MSFTIWPDKMYEDSTGALVVKTAYVSLTAATNNQLMVTAVSGKKILVLSGHLTSLGAQSDVAFLSASGGAVRKYLTIPANTVATPNVELVYNPVGWVATNSGEGLYMNCGAVAVNADVRYIEVTP